MFNLEFGSLQHTNEIIHINTSTKLCIAVMSLPRRLNSLDAWEKSIYTSTTYVERKQVSLQIFSYLVEHILFELKKRQFLLIGEMNSSDFWINLGNKFLQTTLNKYLLDGTFSILGYSQKCSIHWQSLSWLARLAVKGGEKSNVICGETQEKNEKYWKQ